MEKMEKMEKIRGKKRGVMHKYRRYCSKKKNIRI